MNDKNIDFRELENVLIKLYGKIEIIEELQKHKGDKFNIFSILKMERLEVRTHSAFLYELINPKGTHYQDDKYLRIFVDEVLKIEDFDFVNVKVDRETLIDANRRIDFTIENDDYYVAIEMKIDATDQDKQLSDYFEYAKKQKQEFSKVYYLTLDGRDADEKSAKEVEYKKISFQFDILNFIEKSIEKSANLPIIRESLIQYKNLILNITNQTTQELQMESIKFINSSDMARAANYMSNNLAYAWAGREVLFWRYLAIKLEKYLKDKKNWELKQEIFYVSDEDENINDFDDEIVRWIVEKLGKDDMRGLFLQKNDFCFCIYSHNSGVLRYIIDKEKNIKNISEQIGLTRNFKNLYKFKETKYKLNFCKDYENPTYDIFDNDKLDEIVENIFKEIKSYMDIIVKELN